MSNKPQVKDNPEKIQLFMFPLITLALFIGIALIMYGMQFIPVNF